MKPKNQSSHLFQVIHGLESLPDTLHGGVAAIGNFDGVHRGHAAVIRQAKDHAARIGSLALALTFEPHPRAFFQPDQPLRRISSLDDRLALLAWRGLDAAVVLPFDASLASQTAEEFVNRVLVGALKVKAVVVGHDFHFGKGRGGSPAFLREAGLRHGFAVDVVAPEGGALPYSSSAVRNSLSKGDVETANAVLGYRWFVSGHVRHGEKRGRDLGFPTANIALPDTTPLAPGIYAVRAELRRGTYEGVASFGRRPTFDNGHPLLEVYLFDMTQDLYGQDIKVEFVRYLRPELKFDSVDALVTQMQQDSSSARALLHVAAAENDTSTFTASQGKGQ
jgi:riboflavin kinase/FMN adenylyltransferase